MSAMDRAARNPRPTRHIETIEAIAGLPDMPFTANAGLLHGKRFVPSRFLPCRAPWRGSAFHRLVSQRAGSRSAALPERIVFEGAGDALFDEAIDLLWMGHGQRSEFAAAAGLARLLDIDTVPLRLVDPRFYHLDTCFCPLPRRCAALVSGRLRRGFARPGRIADPFLAANRRGRSRCAGLRLQRDQPRQRNRAAPGQRQAQAPARRCRIHRRSKPRSTNSTRPVDRRSV